ncbi:MAG: MarR family transcriptional regulator [Actinobacteria bacterium]|nr:MarR family transcriptional regulator [Actinomycetota bacterium]MDQ3530789.1 MarR family transcriptional regulator [Actinomycetota bacterium]
MPVEVPLRVEEDYARRYPGADKLATECVVNLLRTQGLVTAELARRFRQHGLTGPGFNVLMILEGAGEPLCPYEIGERQLVTRGTVTGLLDTLQKQGLVRRIPHPKDRRMLLIEITEQALSLLEQVCDDLFPAQAEMMSVLSARDKESLVRLLGKLQTHLGGESRDPVGSAPPVQVPA